MPRYQVIIVGGGPVGLAMAVELGQRDVSVALIERHVSPQQIPKGQRVTKAELTLQVQHVDGKARLRLRRLQAEWGAGVCHQYRMVHPKKLEWSQPGAQGTPAIAPPRTAPCSRSARR